MHITWQKKSSLFYLSFPCKTISLFSMFYRHKKTNWFCPYSNQFLSCLIFYVISFSFPLFKHFNTFILIQVLCSGYYSKMLLNHCYSFQLIILFIVFIITIIDFCYLCSLSVTIIMYHHFHLPSQLLIFSFLLLHLFSQFYPKAVVQRCFVNRCS